MPPSDSKYRIITVSAAIVLGLCSLGLTIAITGAILALPGFNSGPGAFLAACYGLLALGIPAVLFYAAVILVDREWRPDRIFILAVSLFPFMTLATGVVFVRDYDSRVDQFFFLAWAGKTGFSFTVVILTVLEVLVIMIIRGLLFSHHESHKPGFFRRIPHIAWLKPIEKLFGGETAPAAPPSASYPAASGAAASPATGPITPAAPAAEHPPDTGISLPELKPLASAAAMENLERIVQPPPTEPLPEAGAADAAPAAGTDAEEEPSAALPAAPAMPEAPAAQLIIPQSAASPSGTVVEVVSVKPKPVPKTRIRGSWKVPVDILNHYPDGEYWIIDEATRAAAVTLRSTLEEFHIQAEVTGIRKGPVITMFEILPAPGVKLSKIVNLQDNIALRLAASSVRIVAPIPGKHA
ncbi:MAG: hypothetical protein LBL56_01685, partial [Treponema sp.]|nr:hypothetical protein [Treponema sp.]